MVATGGFEPPTCRVWTGRYRPTKLRRHIQNVYMRRNFSVALAFCFGCVRLCTLPATKPRAPCLACIYPFWGKGDKRRSRNPENLVAGAGFEPRDLRVMSPTSYLTAPPRIKGICSILLIFVFVNRFPSAGPPILSILLCYFCWYLYGLTLYFNILIDFYTL